MTPTKETWRQIKGYEGLYWASSLGRIMSCYCILSSSALRNGYPSVNLRKGKEGKSFLIHRLIALTFIPNPENKKEVNHIDKDRQNNRVENLEWATKHENTTHQYKQVENFVFNVKVEQLD